MIGKIINICLLICSVATSCLSQTKVEGEGNLKFKKRVLQSNLQDPWDITYGPDDYLWITESKGYKVSRIDIASGKTQVILDLNSERSFSGKPWPQGGLMGMALHPKMNSGKPFVYLAYVYRFVESRSNFAGNYFKTKVVRYTWNKEKLTLSNPKVLCDTIPGSNDHNGGRLHIADIDGKEYLFYSVGDMGAGQFDNGNRPNHAQDPKYYQGKILRFNTEEDNDKEALDRWVPNSNPFRNAVWSIGHRNPQGLASVTVAGKKILYSTEHGPYSDDEINLIERGANYGHPLVIGYNDGNYDGLAASVSDHDSLPGKWNTTYPLIEKEAANAAKIGSSYRNPIKAFSPNENSFLTGLFTAVANNAGRSDWSSEAPSSLEVYTSNAIPGWRNSLLIPTLKTGRLIRLKVDDSGKGLKGEEESYFQAGNRLRDVAISPDGKKIYLITDRSSVTSGPTKEDPQGSNEKGAVIEFSYTGQ
ncbi:PQQ-dependent sugar dehydrogenase [Desertivirga arenae]|uniref:PQQ-dependent sugar dehydrogenase n=1 Tax=Desertivirga arenae TaxID=2810309 RepID=UPI001A962470|nr:PQQ-dependent sugar dehydrogenase [Pedobacter sp. SYSU D00823]